MLNHIVGPTKLLDRVKSYYKGLTYLESRFNNINDVMSLIELLDRVIGLNSLTR